MDQHVILIFSFGITLNQSTDVQAGPSLTSVIDSASHSSAAVVTSVSSRAAPKDELKTLLDALGWTAISKTTYQTRDGFQFQIRLLVPHLLESNFGGFTGLFMGGKILLKGATDLNNFIRVLNLLGLVDLEASLKQQRARMTSIKILYQQQGFPDALLDCLSFASIIINHPLAFGCEKIDKRDDFAESSNRRYDAFAEAYQALSRFCKVSGDQPRKGYEAVFNFPKCLFDDQPALKRFQRERANLGFSSYICSHSLPESFKMAQKRDLCMNDTLPGWFRTWFPYGMHLVSTEDDQRTELEKFNALGRIAQEYLVTPCLVANPDNLSDFSNKTLA